jgi:hypothetical protein
MIANLGRQSAVSCASEPNIAIMLAAGPQQRLKIALIMSPRTRHAADKGPKFMIGARGRRGAARDGVSYGGSTMAPTRR